MVGFDEDWSEDRPAVSPTNCVFCDLSCTYLKPSRSIGVSKNLKPVPSYKAMQWYDRSPQCKVGCVLVCEPCRVKYPWVLVLELFKYYISALNVQTALRDVL